MPSWPRCGRTATGLRILRVHRRLRAGQGLRHRRGQRRNAYVTGGPSTRRVSGHRWSRPDLQRRTQAMPSWPRCGRTGPASTTAATSGAQSDGGHAASPRTAAGRIRHRPTSSSRTISGQVGPDLTYNGSGRMPSWPRCGPTEGADYCGYIGGNGGTIGFGIAVDTAGAPTSPATPIPPRRPSRDLGPDLTSTAKRGRLRGQGEAGRHGLDYCGYIGGGGADYGYGIAVDTAANAYVSGPPSPARPRSRSPSALT